MDVSIVACKAYEKNAVRAALDEALAPLNVLSRIEKGTRVAVKANLVSFAAPEKAVTTHPIVLEALCDILTERGATVVIGDSPGGLYNAAFVGKVYKTCGLLSLEREGVSLNRDYSQREASFPEAVELKNFVYTSYLDDADVIIDVCKLKTHGMMGMSAAAKNLFGVIPGTMKPEYHFRFPTYERFADMIVDLNDYFKPAFAICDAVVGMEGNGPTAGKPREIGCILASESTHKLDLVAAKIIGLTKEQVPTLLAAYNRGKIPATAEELTLYGDLGSLIIDDFENIAVLHSLGFSGTSDNVLKNIFGRVARAALNSRPKLKKSECIGCNLCGTICPAKAITIVDKKAVIDKQACIRCFCCQEFCPKGAMKVYRTPIARLLNKQ